MNRYATHAVVSLASGLVAAVLSHLLWPPLALPPPAPAEVFRAAEDKRRDKIFEQASQDLAATQKLCHSFAQQLNACTQAQLGAQAEMNRTLAREMGHPLPED